MYLVTPFGLAVFAASHNCRMVLGASSRGQKATIIHCLTEVMRIGSSGKSSDSLYRPLIWNRLVPALGVAISCFDCWRFPFFNKKEVKFDGLIVPGGLAFLDWISKTDAFLFQYLDDR